MSKANRPLSPHLQVYKLPMTATMSITFRAMGVGLSLGFVVLAVWLIAAAIGRETFDPVHGLLAGSIVGNLLLIGLTAAFYYHACNGLRHLVWDTGRGIGNESVVRSGRAVLLSAGVLTVATVVAGLW